MSTALAKANPSSLTAAPSHDAQVITQRLGEASANYHLVAPATSVEELPEGCSISTSLVKINPDTTAGDVYPIKGQGSKLGLSKTALDKIAGAAGVNWDPHLSRRIDDGRNPHYCCWIAVGSYRHFDGSLQMIQGTKEVDLREGSAQVAAIMTAAKSVEDGDRQLMQQRAFIAAHAETKARLRAIRAMGIKTAYTAKELEKPFAVARMAFTGATNDPDLRREFALMRAHQMIGGSAALYGQPAPLPLQHMPMPALLPATPAPPISRVRDADFDDDDVPSPPLHRNSGAIPTAATTAPPGSPASPPDGKPSAGRSGATIQFGRDIGKAIEDVSDSTLEWYAGSLAKSITDPTKARYQQENQRALDAVRAEQARRAAPPPAQRESGRQGAAAPADDFPAELDRGPNPNDY